MLFSNYSPICQCSIVKRETRSSLNRGWPGAARCGATVFCFGHCQVFSARVLQRARRAPGFSPVGDTPKIPTRQYSLFDRVGRRVHNSTARLSQKLNSNERLFDTEGIDHRSNRSPISIDDVTFTNTIILFVFLFSYTRRDLYFNDMAFLDQKEITHFLAQELFYQQFITFEGLNSGVPTRTTPTLTPTTTSRLVT
ncbi:unnamed protein product [Callosobruchus maculatus]|uniref:Uncharacterized protein n=1 Tax=Callosobruchus maculatus TaxID=64391 RepID=A0A653C127_CALMS|nr:unnamed protein product [Callosobruchus maculatus]